MAVVPGLGTLLKHGITSTYTTIAQRVSIQPPGYKMGSADTTTLDSANETSRPTLANFGVVKMKIQYDPASATHKLLTGFAAAGSSAVELWQVVFADVAPTTVPFTGYVSSFQPNEMSAQDNAEADLEITLNTCTFPT